MVLSLLSPLDYRVHPKPCTSSFSACKLKKALKKEFIVLSSTSRANIEQGNSRNDSDGNSARCEARAILRLRFSIRRSLREQSRLLTRQDLLSDISVLFKWINSYFQLVWSRNVPLIRDSRTWEYIFHILYNKSQHLLDNFVTNCQQRLLTTQHQKSAFEAAS